MELRSQYAKTEDGVNIAYWTTGAVRVAICLRFGLPRDAELCRAGLADVAARPFQGRARR